MHPRTRKLGLWLTIIAVLTLVIGLAPSSQAATGKDGLVPSVNLSMQGRLTDAAGAPITTATNVTFSIYIAPDSINPIYTESASITPDASGLYTYLLGTNNTIDQAIVAQFSHQLYLGVTVGADAEMTPRFALSASPYALSLAPGAVADGSVSGTAAQYGTINGINELSNSSDNAGLYGKGATGVRGEAQSSGATGGYGGYFSNAGGGTGNHYGVYGQNSSSGGASGYGGFFENYSGGSGSQFGIRANNTSSGGTSGYAGYFQNTGGGSGNQIGVYATSPGYGFFGQSNASTGAQNSAGVVGNSNASGGFGGVFTGTTGVSGNGQLAVKGVASSSGSNSSYGGSFVNGGGGNNAQYGVQAINNSVGGTSGFGGYFQNIGGGSGTQYGLYTSSPGYGLYADAGANGSRPSVGVVGRSSASAGIGGVFTGTSGVVISATSVGLDVQSSGAGSGDKYAANFYNYGAGTGNQYGINVHNDTHGGTDGYGALISNIGRGSGNQYGVYVANISLPGSDDTYGGYFYTLGSGGTDYGIHSYASDYSGYFDSDSNTEVALYVRGAIDATGACCLAEGYTVKVKYNGAATLHAGDVLAADGNNVSVDGMSILGTVKANTGNAKASICVAQQRLKSIGKDKDSGRDLWQLDSGASEFKAGDLISCVALGQVRMKAAGATIGDSLTLSANGNPTIASDNDRHTVGKVVSAADKDGYVTVFVNLK